ncbi:hypothetical protein [Rossellomorea vietnamensis]|uniref:hypothetical protein n=1 Tax=Rossellomorea vietnamensis TaxID=218284 RepID=UPI00077C4F63|nr:hypothetical protein [Rossellomorea vietnamensis]
MKRFFWKKGLLIIFGVLLILAISLPLLAPVVHNDDSPRSAIRNYIYSEGYTYQSFFSFISDDDYKDQQYGERYSVVWNAWKSETGMSPSTCYAQKTGKDHYEVTCGTGP